MITFSEVFLEKILAAVDFSKKQMVKTEICLPAEETNPFEKEHQVAFRRGAQEWSVCSVGVDIRTETRIRSLEARH